MTTLPRLSELAGDYVLDTASTRIGFIANPDAPGQPRSHCRAQKLNDSSTRGRVPQRRHSRPFGRDSPVAR